LYEFAGKLVLKTFASMTCATQPQAGLECKAPIFATVAQLLGHKDLRMAARYQHLSPAFLGEAVNRLDSIFGNPRYLAPPSQLSQSSHEIRGRSLR